MTPACSCGGVVQVILTPAAEPNGFSPRMWAKVFGGSGPFDVHRWRVTECQSCGHLESYRTPVKRIVSAGLVVVVALLSIA